MAPARILVDLVATQPSDARYHGAAECGLTIIGRLCRMTGDIPVIGFYDPGEEVDPRLHALKNEGLLELVGVSSVEETNALLRQSSGAALFSSMPYRLHAYDFSGIHLFLEVHGMRYAETPTDRYEWIYGLTGAEWGRFLVKQVNPAWYRQRQKRKLENLLKVPCAQLDVVVSSLHTKYALVSEWPWLKSDRLSICYPPPKTGEAPAAAEILNKFGVTTKSYFLIVSGQRWMKNSYRAMLALDELYSRFGDQIPSTLIVGVTKPAKMLRGMKHPGRFILKDYVEGAVLERLYKDAYALIYPTLNEGFGYPPLESMKYGVPVACSAITSTTEICGDGVRYFNPLSVDEMRSRLTELVFDKDEYDRIGHAGQLREKSVAATQEKMLADLCGRIISSS